MPLIKSSPQITELPDNVEKFRYIQIFLQSVQKIVNGRLSYADNMSLPFKEVVFETADTNKTIDHGLGRRPRGYIVVGKTVNMVVYEGSIEKNTRQITLKSSAAGTAKIVFL